MKMRLLMLVSALSVPMAAQAAIDQEGAIRVAKAYALGVDPDIGSHLDGETLDEALANPQIVHDRYSFMLQDSSGDCGLEISVFIESGEIDLINTDPRWRCD